MLEMSWDPSAAFRTAMEEQLKQLRTTLDAVDDGDEHAEEMRRRLQEQIDDLDRRVAGLTIAGGSAKAKKPGVEKPALPAVASSRADIRAKVWSRLREVARPDSRFHYDFTKFIPDFQESSKAIARLTALPCYQNAKVVFITPDNCLEGLRYKALCDGKTVLTTTYGIRRGFWILDPNKIPQTRYEYACCLDGLERVGQAVSMSNLLQLKTGLKIDLMVTGASAVNTKGVRYGKGHGFFDLEWGMLFTLGLVSSSTPTAAIVHDCQLLEEELQTTDLDTGCDVIAAPSQLIEVKEARKPRCGIVWDKLEANMLDEMRPLQELRHLIKSGVVLQP